MFKKISSLWKILGPGFITGASDDDPSGIATYAQTGAQFGFTQLWTAFLSVPFMISVQEMSGRIALVTGKGLGGVLKQHYSRTVLYTTLFLLIVANTINIGADLGAMAASAQLIIPLPFFFILFAITLTTLLLEVFVSYKVYARYLKYLTFTLLSYIVAAFLIPGLYHHTLNIAYHTFLPHISFTKDYFFNIVAILGTTISPYLFFWQAEEEIEESKTHKRKALLDIRVPFRIAQKSIRALRFDTAVGMILSNVIMFFIILTTAATLNANGIFNVETADQAAAILKPISGQLSSLLFAIGIIGTGLLTVPILAGSASYALGEAFNLKSGLYRKFSQAHGFYGILTLSTLVGLILNTLNIPPFRLLYYTALINGIIAPFLILVIIRIANNEKIMGKYTNDKLSNSLGMITAIGMSIASLCLLIQYIL